MIPKWLFYLLDAAAYPLAIFLAFWLADKVDFGGSDAAGQGMAAGFGALAYAAISVAICFVVSIFASSALVRSGWHAVAVFAGFIVVLLLWWSINVH